jgi:hypothetical protein
VADRFTAKERQRVIDSVNDQRFADLTPAQIVAILAEERVCVGSESTAYRGRDSLRGVDFEAGLP